MGYQIFVSYRRATGDFTAQSFYYRLRDAGYRVFYDIEAMRSGKFNEQLYNVIDECSDFLLILTEGALDRCNNVDDWVRLEIEHALKTKKNIVPVLTRNFKFPDLLPESIKEIPYYHGVIADTEFFDEVIRRLGKLLKATPDAPVAAHEEQRAAAPHETPRGEPDTAATRGAASRHDGGTTPMPPARSKRMGLIIGAVCVMLAAVGGGWWLTRSKGDAQATRESDKTTISKTVAPAPPQPVPPTRPEPVAPASAKPVPPAAPGTDAPGVDVPGEPETCASAKPETDVSRLKERAEAGEPDAQYRLGCLYKKGEGGVPQSDSEAAHWFKPAADQDIQAAAKFKYELALMYETGRGGLPKDDSQAAKLLTEAARTYPQAQFKLGMKYYSGRGVYQSFKKARECFLKAARQNLPEAQHALAWLYEKGKGGAKDEDSAREWYRKAVNQGFEPSRAALERLDAQAR